MIDKQNQSLTEPCSIERRSMGNPDSVTHSLNTMLSDLALSSKPIVSSSHRQYPAREYEA